MTIDILVMKKKLKSRQQGHIRPAGVTKTSVQDVADFQY